MPKRVFVSGCYDILHAGHVQFFSEAAALGDHLTVCFASDAVLWEHKQRRSSLPEEHKLALMQALRMVDAVVIGRGAELGLDFKEHFLRLRPDILVVTEDDKYTDVKKALCAEVGCQYVRLDKTPPLCAPLSTTDIVSRIRAPARVPLRVDFAGGWLDVPRHARGGAYIVNCAVSPLVSLSDWPYHQQAGLGGSAAWALLNGKDPIHSELQLGVGWQDPAVISEGGLCVWRSGPMPHLELKSDGGFLDGRMALHWTGQQHDTPGMADDARDYAAIEAAGAAARRAVQQGSLELLAQAVAASYALQLAEQMAPLPGDPNCAEPLDFGQPQEGAPLAFKYCGGGHGGYAVYLFGSQAARDAACARLATFLPIEPWNSWGSERR